MSTAIRLAVSATGFILLIATAEAMARRWSLSAEVGRKLAHVWCGLLAAALPFFLSFPAIALLSVAFVPFMVSSRQFQLFPVIHSAERSTYGEVYFPIGVLLVALLVPHRNEYVFGVLVLAIADAAANIFGRRYGRRSYKILSGHKTYAGSATFLFSTIGLGMLVMSALGEVTAITAFAVTAAAAIVTIEEGLLGGGMDNVVLPVTAAAILEMMT
ncbi:MAG TPA: hypothetical protein VFA00_04680 [Actinomycetota bacterium]|nr:hypothetical protein [Actinomycetota bacterium]